MAGNRRWLVELLFFYRSKETGLPSVRFSQKFLMLRVRPEAHLSLIDAAYRAQEYLAIYPVMACRELCQKPSRVSSPQTFPFLVAPTLLALERRSRTCGLLYA